MRDREGQQMFRGLVPAAVAVALVLGLLGASPPDDDEMVARATTGDAILAHAATLPGVTTYRVPVSFDVHVHHPIGARMRVGGTAYFRAPADAALAITHVPALIGGLFRGTYKLDVVPQAWPARYHVIAVATTTNATGVRVTQLTAVPRTAGDVAQAVFEIGPDGAPISAVWTYTDHSTITLALTNALVGRYTLPAHGDIAVALPTYHIEASATYGAYDFNVPLADEVFVPTK